MIIDVSKILNDKYFRTQIMYILLVTKNSIYFFQPSMHMFCFSNFVHPKKLTKCRENQKIILEKIVIQRVTDEFEEAHK